MTSTVPQIALGGSSLHLTNTDQASGTRYPIRSRGPRERDTKPKERKHVLDRETSSFAFAAGRLTPRRPLIARNLRPPALERSVALIFVLARERIRLATPWRRGYLTA